MQRPQCPSDKLKVIGRRHRGYIRDSAGKEGQHACLFFWPLQLDYPFLGHTQIIMSNHVDLTSLACSTFHNPDRCFFL